MIGHNLQKSSLRSRVRLLGLLILVLCMLGALTAAYAAPPAAPSHQGGDTTPYQTALRNAIDSRKAAGLPVPASVTYNLQTSGGDAQSLRGQGAPTGPITITATTTIFFDGPEQAGYSEWPALVVQDNLPAEVAGGVRAGDYTETYRATIAARFPGIWDQYTFGHEPRRETITETWTLTASQAVPQGAGAMSGMAAVSEGILMGFTYEGPHIDYAIEDSAEICDPTGVLGCATLYHFKAGFELDWALGLRLPAQASLSGPDQMVAGNTYNLTSSLTPQDWSASSYSGAGAAAENGNEFVMRLSFFVGVQGELLGVDLCPSCHVDVDFDESKSFTTPFGAGASFPIPPVSIPVYTFDLSLFSFSVDLDLTPQIGSDKITADWQAVPGSDCSGSGTVTYTEPGVPVSVGPVKACNLGPTDQAQIQLSNFRYWFTQFLVKLSAGLDFKLFGYGVWNPTVPITDFNLSPIFGGGLDMGRHVQCDYAFNCVNAGPDNSMVVASQVVDQTAPTTTIGLAGLVGNNGWHRSDVTVTLSAVDGPVDCGVGVDRTEYSLDGTTWVNYTGPFVLSNEGITTVSYRSIDLSGNVEPTQTQIVRIDKTPPIITGAPTTPPNAFGWWNTDVVVHFEASDAVSGIDTVTPDVTVSTEGANQQVIGTAVDMAGNSAQFTVMNINIDKTPPGLTITSPLAITYPNTAPLTIDWTATDGLSGIASETADLDGAPVTNGQAVDLLLTAAGNHTVTVTVVDRADNSTTQSVTFFVSTDLNGLIAALDHMCSLGLISNQGICNSLRVKLDHARTALDRGQCKVAENALKAFTHELDAQNGKHVPQDAYNVLRADVDFVLANLPPCSDQDPPAATPDPGGSPPDNPGNGNGNGNDHGNGNGNGNGHGNGNPGNGNGNGNGHGNGDPGNGNGNGHGNPPDNPGNGNGNGNPPDNPGNGNGNGHGNGNGNGNPGNGNGSPPDNPGNGNGNGNGNGKNKG